MRAIRFTLIVLLVGGIGIQSEAQELFDNTNFTNGSIEGWKFRNKNAEIQAIEQGESNGVKITVAKSSAQAWETRLEQRTKHKLNIGERIVLKVELRCTQKLPFFFGMQKIPYAPILRRKINTTPEWKVFEVQGWLGEDIALL